MLRSQNRTVESPEPLASCRPQGLNATESTASRWPGIVAELRVIGSVLKNACGRYRRVTDSTETRFCFRCAPSSPPSSRSST